MYLLDVVGNHVIRQAKSTNVNLGPAVIRPNRRTTQRVNHRLEVESHRRIVRERERERERKRERWRTWKWKVTAESWNCWPLRETLTGKSPAVGALERPQDIAVPLINVAVEDSCSEKSILRRT